MKRALAFLIVAVALAAALNTRSALASGDCSWRENGAIVEHDDGTRSQCHCEHVKAIDEYWCTWITIQPAIRARPTHRKHARLVAPIRLVVTA